MDLDRWLFQPFLDDTFPLPLCAPFTTAQAVREGVPRRWLSELVSAGLLRHPVKGCYLSSHLPDDVATRAACLRLVVPEDAVVVDRHAGWLHGAEMLLRPNEHLDALPIAMYLPAGRGRLRNKLADSGERTFLPEDLTEVEGVRATTVLRTALDLGRQRWPEPALTALDALHRLGVFTIDELVAEVDRFTGMRWVTTLRLVAPHTDGRSQSGGETVIRWRWKHLPLPSPTPQVEVRNAGRVAFIDVGVETTRFGCEFDGEEFHTEDEDREHDQTRRAWLDEDADWVIKPVTTKEVYRGDGLLDAILVEGFKEAIQRVRRRTAA
ncbi:hypothetical protein DDE18_11400 [Nocardioides gansuensis]|uniref:AbiEi antitoxin C-terminal domain-containing protein n=1 Tax=Nocardioides gansuensis TaxID=2138300 RepID=A0A2T8FB47_9ACTN|nr:type IV toxin-antitoxin system AbiEi family antitoxin domain-containing protein [Nocardioides gansuensis]PVG82941.1 hypothetical protein DDE18_11400 [Nocardioides gansuensis]